jgi:hypothetical protein
VVFFVAFFVPFVADFFVVFFADFFVAIGVTLRREGLVGERSGERASGQRGRPPTSGWVSLRRGVVTNAARSAQADVSSAKNLAMRSKPWFSVSSLAA